MLFFLMNPNSSIPLNLLWNTKISSPLGKLFYFTMAKLTRYLLNKNNITLHLSYLITIVI